MKLIFSLFCFFTFTLVQSQESVDEVLNQWHKAAEQAEFETYFSYFADDAHFIGTDANENWSLAEFKEYAKTSFEVAPAWEFIPVQRNVNYSENQKMAWFDEVLASDHLGVCRGSGVLIYENESWKIKHYVLSLIVPNELAKEVAKLKRKADTQSLTELMDN